MFYCDIISYISVNLGLTLTIQVSRGIRQGCPISLEWFTLCTQLMAYLITDHPEIEGITTFDHEFCISQFADDTVCFLKDKPIIGKAGNFHFFRSIWFEFKFEQM